MFATFTRAAVKQTISSAQRAIKTTTTTTTVTRHTNKTFLQRKQQPKRAFATKTVQAAPQQPPINKATSSNRKLAMILGGAFVLSIPITYVVQHFLDDTQNSRPLPDPSGFNNWVAQRKTVLEPLFDAIGVEMTPMPLYGTSIYPDNEYPHYDLEIPPLSSDFSLEAYYQTLNASIAMIKVIEDITIEKIFKLEEFFGEWDNPLAQEYKATLQHFKALVMAESPLSGINSQDNRDFLLKRDIVMEEYSEPVQQEGIEIDSETENKKKELIKQKNDEHKHNYLQILIGVSSASAPLAYLIELDNYVTNHLALVNIYKNPKFQQFMTKRSVSDEAKEFIHKIKKEQLEQGIGLEEQQLVQKNWEVRKAQLFQEHQRFLRSPEGLKQIELLGPQHPSLQFNLPDEAPDQVLEQRYLPRLFVDDFSHLWSTPKGDYFDDGDGPEAKSVPSRIKMLIIHNFKTILTGLHANMRENKDQALKIEIDSGKINGILPPKDDMILDLQQILLYDQIRALIMLMFEPKDPGLNPNYEDLLHEAFTKCNIPLTFSQSLVSETQLFREPAGNHVLASLPNLPLIPLSVTQPSDEGIKETLEEMKKAGVVVEDVDDVEQDKANKRKAVVEWLYNKYDDERDLLPEKPSSLHALRLLKYTNQVLRELQPKLVSTDGGDITNDPTGVKKMAELKWLLAESLVLYSPFDHVDADIIADTIRGKIITWAEYLALRRRNNDGSTLDYTVLDKVWVPWQEGDLTDPRSALYSTTPSDRIMIKRQEIIDEVYKPVSQSIGKIAFKRSRADQKEKDIQQQQNAAQQK